MVSETFPCSYTSPHNHSWIFETLWVIIFWVRVTHKMLNVELQKNSLNNFMCHLSWFQKLSPNSYTSPHIHSKPCKLLFFELESLIKCWMWIGTKIHSIILCVTCHGFRNFPLFIHIPLYPFKTLQIIIFWVRVTHKMLNVNWEKIHSIILCVTRHGFRNFPLFIHIHTKPFVNFWIPASYYFLS